MASFAQMNKLADELPAGRYALPGKADGEVFFFEIKPVGGWSTKSVASGTPGHRIFRLQGAPGDFAQHTMKFAWQVAALTKIAGDVKAAITFFGQKSRTCGACNSPLTHSRSRACGMGPKCAPRWGVKW
jgi:hypothetical protein